jgi:DNA-directed RNA polymerase subunit beta'
MKLVEVRDANRQFPSPTLQGITQASWAQKALFQLHLSRKQRKFLVKLRSEAKLTSSMGLKENVIVGHLIPAGTGMREYRTYNCGFTKRIRCAGCIKEEFNRIEELQSK